MMNNINIIIMETVEQAIAKMQYYAMVVLVCVALWYVLFRLFMKVYSFGVHRWNFRLLELFQEKKAGNSLSHI